jgi:8-amino-7-oxononanoate synthase
MREPLESRVRERLRALEQNQLLRTLTAPAGIDLSSNDYLGLARDPRLCERMIEAVGRDGCGSTGSRLLRGHRDGFDAVERRFAEFKGTERALYFSSGYLANLAVLTTFPEAGDVIFSDELNHASLIDGARLSAARRVVFPHNDVQALRRLLEVTPVEGQRFVVTESLFSMDGDTAPLSEYASLCRSAGALLVVDEAHAVGVHGSRGTGLIETSAGSADVLVSINTAGKALGVAGAFVAGAAWAIEYLIQRARPFIFSTAPPPAVAAALEASLDIVISEPERRRLVMTRARMMRERLATAGIPVPAGFSQIIPVILGDNERALAVARDLQRQGFDVRAIRPPSVPTGTARIRIAVNATISEPTIDRFTMALAAAMNVSGPCCVVSS